MGLDIIYIVPSLLLLLIVLLRFPFLVSKKSIEQSDFDSSIGSLGFILDNLPLSGA